MDKYINMKTLQDLVGNGSFSPFSFGSINAWWLLFGRK